MNAKLIIREIKIVLIRAEYELAAGKPDKAEELLCYIYNFIHYGGIAAGYQNKDKIHPPKH